MFAAARVICTDHTYVHACMHAGSFFFLFSYGRFLFLLPSLPCGVGRKRRLSSGQRLRSAVGSAAQTLVFAYIKDIAGERDLGGLK